MPGHQKIKTGIVVSRKMNKTAVVHVQRQTIDSTVKKYLKRTTAFKVHDEKNECQMGDVVEIVETRPISREKRWSLVKVLTRGSEGEAESI